MQLRDADLADRVLAIVRDRKLDPTRLQLEITESAILNADAVGDGEPSRTQRAPA